MSVLLIRVVRSTTAQLSHESCDPHPTDRAAPLPFRYKGPGSRPGIVHELADESRPHAEVNSRTAFSVMPMPTQPPLSNPPLRFSSGPPFPCTTPSTVTWVVVVSFMIAAPFSLGLVAVRSDRTAGADLIGRSAMAASTLTMGSRRRAAAIALPSRVWAFSHTPGLAQAGTPR
jgi:hypothetical protein